jgi:hypothetical protein
VRTEKRASGKLAEAYRWFDPPRLEEFFDRGRGLRRAYDSEGHKRGSRTPTGHERRQQRLVRPLATTIR